MLGRLLGHVTAAVRSHPLVAAVPAIVSLVIASWIVVHAWPTWNTDCDVRLTPYLVNVEIDGWKAGAMCERLIADHRKDGYQESSPDGPVICEQTYDGYRVSIHDPEAGIVSAFACAGLPPPATSIQKVVA